MIVSETTLQERLCQFTKEYTDDQCCLLEILQFFGRYPHTRFSGLAVIHALNGRRFYTERALKYLIDKGVVKRYSENNVSLYSLTEDEELRSLVLNLAKLDWGQWQLLLKQIYPASEEQGDLRPNAQRPL